MAESEPPAEKELVQLQRLSAPQVKVFRRASDTPLSAEDALAVKNFQTYLRFPTVHPNPNYSAAVSWLQEQGRALNLRCSIAECVKGNPILVMCWEGTNPKLPSILLNSHMDVVPAGEGWTHDPFEAEMTEDGNIYARGAQDMKCVGIQQLEAVRRLKASGFAPLRTVYLSFVPDEELGGYKGMKPFTEGVIPSRQDGCADEIRFADMNVGFCLDEGFASPGCDFFAFYEERSPWWIRIKATGNAGHGSAFIKDTAFEKLHYVLTKLTELRTTEKQRFEEINKITALGGLVSNNVTVLKGGFQTNVVPSTMEAEVDIRVPPTVNFEAFENMLNRWVKEAGKGVELEFIQKDMGSTGKGCVKNGVDPKDPWWNALKTVTRRNGVDLQIGIFPGATDARYLRRYHRIKVELEAAKLEAMLRATAAAAEEAKGQPEPTDGEAPPAADAAPPPPEVFIPAPAQPKPPIEAINFTPIRKTPILLHDKDEYLNQKEFLFGVKVYTDLLREVALVDGVCADEG